MEYYYDTDEELYNEMEEMMEDLEELEEIKPKSKAPIEISFEKKSGEVEKYIIDRESKEIKSAEVNIELQEDILTNVLKVLGENKTDYINSINDRYDIVMNMDDLIIGRIIFIVDKETYKIKYCGTLEEIVYETYEFDEYIDDTPLYKEGTRMFQALNCKQCYVFPDLSYVFQSKKFGKMVGKKVTVEKIKN